MIGLPAVAAPAAPKVVVFAPDAVDVNDDNCKTAPAATLIALPPEVAPAALELIAPRVLINVKVPVLTLMLPVKVLALLARMTEPVPVVAIVRSAAPALVVT